MTTECKEPLPWTEMLMRTGSKKNAHEEDQTLRRAFADGAVRSIMDTFKRSPWRVKIENQFPCSDSASKPSTVQLKKKVHCSIWRSEYAKLALNHHHLSNDLAANLRRHQLTQDSTQKKSGSSSQVSVSLIRQRQFEAPAGSQKGIHASAQAIPRKLRSGARCRSEECPHLIIVY